MYQHVKIICFFAVQAAKRKAAGDVLLQLIW